MKKAILVSLAILFCITAPALAQTLIGKSDNVPLSAISAHGTANVAR